MCDPMIIICFFCYKFLLNHEKLRFDCPLLAVFVLLRVWTVQIVQLEDTRIENFSFKVWSFQNISKSMIDGSTTGILTLMLEGKKYIYIFIIIKCLDCIHRDLDQVGLNQFSHLTHPQAND